ncbi:MAG: efflux RND transporter periplasmic adaptor subunit, partial [Pseudomonadota bacterium]|nr:efflux RND transporter periplasmic adaptor subunit [Pseudomonadota bacterium]
MKAMTSTLALSVFALFASSVSLSAHAQDSNQPPPVLVQIDEAREQAISQLTWVPGTVLSVIDANFASEVDGRITWMADVGDVV